MTSAHSPLRRRPVPLSRQLLQGAPGRDGVGVVGAEDAVADGEGALVDSPALGQLWAWSARPATMGLHEWSCVAVGLGDHNHSGKPILVVFRLGQV